MWCILIDKVIDDEDYQKRAKWCRIMQTISSVGMIFFGIFCIYASSILDLESFTSLKFNYLLSAMTFLTFFGGDTWATFSISYGFKCLLWPVLFFCAPTIVSYVSPKELRRLHTQWFIFMIHSLLDLYLMWTTGLSPQQYFMERLEETKRKKLKRGF